MSKPAKDWLKVFAWAALPLLGFWLYGLFDLDEGFYAAIVGEMNRRGEWITPFYNGHAWFEKPILLYWLTKPSLALFGGVLGLRLPDVLATLCLYGFAAWFAARRFSLRAAQWAVLILGSSILIVALGRMIMTDALLCLCLSGALLAFFESLVGDRRLRLLAAFLLGLSVLAKGPVGCIFFALIAGITYWRERELRPAFRGGWPAGTLIFLAVVASWYLPAYLKHGDVFVQEFLVKQNLQRFIGGDLAHTVPGPAMWFAYVPVLLLGMLPWSLWIWPALRGRGAVSDQSDMARARRYLATWAIVVFLFFSLSGAKLPHYILPVVPPLAILIADLFARRERDKSVRLVPFGAMAACVVVALVVNLGMAAWYRGVFPGVAPQSEAHELAAEAKRLLAQDPAAELAIFKMGRQKKDRGTGKLKVQETDLPSLLFYLDRDALRTDDFSELAGARKPLYILTRAGRIAGDEAAPMRVVKQTDYFVLWFWPAEAK